METKNFKLNEKLLAIVDFGNQKKFYIVDSFNVQSFLDHHSSNRFSLPPLVIFQSAFVYDPVVFQSQLDSQWKSNSTSSPFSNTFKNN